MCPFEGAETTFEHCPSKKHDLFGEHKLEVKGLPEALCAGNHFFTESLILAQDERWRRA